MHRLPSQRLSASHSVNIPADVSEIDRPSERVSEDRQAITGRILSRLIEAYRADPVAFMASPAGQAMSQVTA